MYKQRRDQKQRISCKRCQDRKVKCSRVSPCQRCTTANVQCEFRGDGLKRAPISREYVTALERRIGALEGFLREVNSATNSKQVETSSTINFEGYRSPLSVAPEMGKFSNGTYQVQTPIQTHDDSIMYQGPSHLRSSMLLGVSGGSRSIQHAIPSPTACVDIQIEFQGHAIAECVALFFRWHYPQCMFIDRDQFLLGFMNHSHLTNHFSRCLEYSICALGALMSSEEKIRDLADGFSKSAIRCLESANLLHPQETSMQALMLCSFYQIGKGSFSKAWMLSGIALRMYDDLYDTVAEDFNSRQNTPREIESRRSMSMNLYQSDKMISLLLGRSPVISKTKLTTGCRDPETAPCIWPIWLEQNGLSDFQTSETSAHPNLALNQQTELCNIIHDMILPNQPSWRGPDTLATAQRWTSVVISDLNARLWGWHNNLPPNLRWNRWGSCFDTLDPSIASLHMLFHATQISLNLPFLAPRGNQDHSSVKVLPKVVTDALEICETSVDIIVSVLRRFKSQYTLKKASLVLVQGAIAAADAAVAIHSYSVEKPISGDSNLRALNEALLGLSYSWSIAANASARLRDVILEKVSDSMGRECPSLSLRESSIPFTSDFGSYSAFIFENGDDIDPEEVYIPQNLSAGACGMLNPYMWDPNLPASTEFDFTRWW